MSYGLNDESQTYGDGKTRPGDKGRAAISSTRAVPPRRLAVARIRVKSEKQN